MPTYVTDSLPELKGDGSSAKKQDLFVEVDHGPFLVDHNIFLSKVSQQSVSQGGSYTHNLFCGSMQLVPFDARMTPYMKAHSTIVAGLHNNPDGTCGS
jgi:alpha-L-arabinofuranosidase